jgi:signal transduction histidine kinase
MRLLSERVKRWWAPVALTAAGLIAAVGLAMADAMSTSHTLSILRDSVFGAAGVGALAGAVLMAVRRARVSVQITVAAVAPVVAVGAGVVWAASSMFLTGQDLSVLWVVLVSAGTVGIVCAWVLGRRVAAASRQVGLMARHLEDPGPTVPSTGSAPAELAWAAAEFQRTSARLVEARAEALAAEKARRDLVAWVSHDLRTPLSGIKLMVEALEERVVDDPGTVDRYYATIRREADRLSGLVDDLFELSRLEAGSRRLDLALTSLGDVVADAVDAAAAAARTGRVTLRHVQVADPVRVAIDVAAVARVVRNLVDNAIRHTAAGGTVTVRTNTIDGARPEAVVTVADGCGGIPEADLDRVFEAGFRGDPARAPGTPGGGFGLAIAQGLVEAHQGSLRVHNAGAGCCFEVRLPISAMRSRSAAPAETRR